MTKELLNLIDVVPHANCRVPFGIRAIENGIKVEGIWISPPTSPQNSRRSSPVSSPGPRLYFSHGSSQASFLRDDNERRSRRGSKHLDSIDSSLPTQLQSNNLRLPERHSSTFSSRDIGSIMPTGKEHDNRIEYSHHRSKPDNDITRETPFVDSSVRDITSELMLPRIDRTESTKLPGNSFLSQPTRVEDANIVVRQNAFAFRVPRIGRSNSNTSIATTVRISETPSGRLMTCNQHLFIKVHGPDNVGDLDLYDKHRLSQVASMGQLVPRNPPLLETLGSADSIQSDDYFRIRTIENNSDEYNTSISSNAPITEELAQVDSKSGEEIAVNTVQHKLGGEYRRFYENGYRTDSRAEDVQHKPHRALDWSMSFFRRGLVRSGSQQASEGVLLDDLESQSQKNRQRKLHKKRTGELCR